jgi:hypothetical protein
MKRLTVGELRKAMKGLSKDAVVELRVAEDNCGYMEYPHAARKFHDLFSIPILQISVKIKETDIY